MAKVIVGMSGGVDSAVAALLLKREGYEVIGVTLRTWVSDDGQDSRCCEIDDARKAAWKIGIRYYPLNCTSVFQNKITEPFMAEYIRGKTPSPCTVCNRYVKWDRLLYAADIMGADYIATGHYASVVKLPDGRYSVHRARHTDKDQAYMLYRLTQEQLSRTLMPLGEMSKQEVRQIAEEASLPVASKPDSQEICFVTDGNYADFIEKHSKKPIPGEGPFVDEEGHVLGTHKGIIHYTVGQRRGLGLSLGYPAYVRAIHPDRNEVEIGREESLYAKSLICSDLNFMSITGLSEGERLSCTVKIRYRHEAAPARIETAGPDHVKVEFDEPVRAAAPGQAAVFYDGDGYVIGGGTIEETFLS